MKWKDSSPQCLISSSLKNNVARSPKDGPLHSLIRWRDLAWSEQCYQRAQDEFTARLLYDPQTLRQQVMAWQMAKESGILLVPPTQKAEHLPQNAADKNDGDTAESSRCIISMAAAASSCIITGHFLDGGWLHRLHANIISGHFLAGCWLHRLRTGIISGHFLNTISGHFLSEGWLHRLHAGIISEHFLAEWLPWLHAGVISGHFLAEWLPWLRQSVLSEYFLAGWLPWLHWRPSSYVLDTSDLRTSGYAVIMGTSGWVPQAGKSYTDDSAWAAHAGKSYMDDSTWAPQAGRASDDGSSMAKSAWPP